MTHRVGPTTPLQMFKNFSALESKSGILLLLSAVLGLLIANSPWQASYHALFNTNFQLGSYAAFHPSFSLRFLINDVLMVIFFLLVGLEIKREIFQGTLNKPAQIALPAIAALGGMIMPAAIFMAINHSHPDTYHGWAIPTATDIAFALGILSLLGSRVPVGLKLFLASLAIFDDIGAIALIGIFYSTHFNLPMLLGALLIVCVGFSFPYLYITRTWMYALLGIVLWFFILKSGIHPTLAGVIFAFMLPLQSKTHAQPLLIQWEKALQPSVAFIILPLFAFANSGVSLNALSWSSIVHPLPLGIILGLVIGKQLGIFGATWITVKTGVATLPRGVNWRSIYAVSAIAGVGFTMSLFMSTLAFQTNPEYLNLARFGILLGSCLSGILGYVFLTKALPFKKANMLCE